MFQIPKAETEEVVNVVGVEAGIIVDKAQIDRVVLTMLRIIVYIYRPTYKYVHIISTHIYVYVYMGLYVFLLL